MIEVSHVLSSKFDSPDYPPAKVNFTSGGQPADAAPADTSSTTSVDPRRYTKFDRTASNAGTDKTFSFSDFLDMINPLEHVPVVSSIYREVTGEKINPVARVAGDMIYGGVFGLASVAISGISAVGDSVMEAETGKDMAGYAMASLFGDDKAKTGEPLVQVASADAAKPQTQTAQVPEQSPALQSQPLTDAQLASVDQAKSALQPMNSETQLASLDQARGTAKAFSLDRSKLPFGGVMAPVPNMQEQNMIMALSEASHAPRMGNTIYTGKFSNGPRPMPVASQPAVPVSAPLPAVASTEDNPGVSVPNMSLSSDAMLASSPQAQRNPIPQALMDDMVMMRALKQYKNTANSTPAGASLDAAN